MATDNQDDRLCCEDCGSAFETGDKLFVVEDALQRPGGIQTYGAEYYHRECLS